jgi:carbon monoxide dehydrogenase subunit G
MQLEHSFTVPIGIDGAWRALLDIEQVAQCMPGAVLESVDGDEFTGAVKVKLGPIALTYKGKAAFIEKDESTHRATIDAQGRDSRGSSTAGAKVTASLAADGDAATRVDVITDLTITGKPAQFGRGVMEEVGNKLIGQFADCLASKLAAGGAPTAEPTESAEADAQPTEPTEPTEPIEPIEQDADQPAAERSREASAVPAAGARADSSAGPGTAAPPRRLAVQPDVEPIDLMASAGPAVAKRLAPVAAVCAVLVLIVVLLRRRRGDA